MAYMIINKYISQIYRRISKCKFCKHLSIIINFKKIFNTFLVKCSIYDN